jgi:hypothetical protein
VPALFHTIEIVSLRINFYSANSFFDEKAV